MDFKEYILERAAEHDAWWLVGWVESVIKGYENKLTNSIEVHNEIVETIIEELIEE